LVARDNRLHRPAGKPRRGRRAFRRGPRHRVFGPSGQTVWSFTPHHLAKGQLQLVVLPLGPHEQPALQAPLHRSGLRRARPATMPSADFCGAVAGPCGPASPDCETRRRSPEVSSTAFAAHPPNLLPRPLMVGTSRFPARSSGLTSLSIRLLSIGSRLCSTLPSNPASRRRSCASLILRSIKLDRGLTPPSCRACSAHWMAGTSPRLSGSLETTISGATSGASRIGFTSTAEPIGRCWAAGLVPGSTGGRGAFGASG